MKITDLLNSQSILINASPENKSDAIDMLLELHDKSGNISDYEEYKRCIFAREDEGSTAVSDGIAIPHAKTDAVKRPSLSAMTVPEGIDCGALDGQDTNLFFMIASPSDGDAHLEVLSKLMTLLLDETLRNNLVNAKSAEEFLKIINDADKEESQDEAEDSCRVLAVTACPTGIAHTYMAAEALEKAGEKLGVSIKVETNGASGVKNRLTQEEIDSCDGIIVAADKTVPMDRFDGKKVIITKVSDGIKIPEDLINKVEGGNIPVYHSQGNEEDIEINGDETLTRRIYKHLMEGVSNMIPFTVAGGIFIAISLFIDMIYGVPDPSKLGTYHPVALWFNTVGNYAFSFMLLVLAAFIAKSIADKPGFLVGLIGGILAVSGTTLTQSTGVSSGFLGALFAGFVGGIIMKYIIRFCERIPEVLDGLKPVLIYPVVGVLVIALIVCGLNPFMGMIYTGLTGLLNSLSSSNKILLGCILAGMMAIDMGGPINKAAYVFGTLALSNGNYDIMASIMLGGMVPPLAIALSTTFFKKYWNPDELKNGPVNYILGLCFITEGAIPYAAGDPLRVIPACVIGSAIAGGLSMAFKCGINAPHGGIFVFILAQNPIMYFVALCIGSFVGMVVLNILKSNIIKHKITNKGEIYDV